MAKALQIARSLIGILALTAASVWAGMIFGIEIQADRDRQWLEETVVSWSARHYDSEGFEKALNQLEESKDQLHQQAALFAREGYRLGRADGMAYAVSEKVESLKNSKK